MLGRGCGQASVPRTRPCTDRRSRGPHLKLYLVRHARAGSRKHWRGADDLRPLSKVGRRQVLALTEMLRERRIERVVSSPLLRCIQTVECVAAERGLEVELSDALVQGVPVDEVLRLVEKVSDRPSVLCTHGEVIEPLLGYLRERKVKLKGGSRFAKGSYWELELEVGEIVSGRYEAPPK